MKDQTPDLPEGGRRPWWPVLAVSVLAAVALVRKPTPEGLRARRATTRPATAVPAAAAGRHEQASAPGTLDWAGWKAVGLHVYTAINDDRLLAVAAGVTFYALLAVFPAIAALVSLYGLFSDPASIAKQLDALNGVLPGGALDIIGEQVKRIADTPHKSLGFALVASLAIATWSANAGMKAVFDAVNVAFDEKEERGFVALNLRSLAFTLGALVLLLLALAAVVVMPIVFNFVGLGGTLDTLLALIRWPVLLALLVGAFVLLYRYGPSHSPAHGRWLLWGGGVAAVLWVLTSILFSFYVGRFGTYNATYGSLGSAIGFMTWIWISSIVVLVGAEITGALDRVASGAPLKGAA